MNATGIFAKTPLNLTANGTTQYRIYILNYDLGNAPNPIPVVNDNVNTIGSITMVSCGVGMGTGMITVSPITEEGQTIVTLVDCDSSSFSWDGNE